MNAIFCHSSRLYDCFKIIDAFSSRYLRNFATFIKRFATTTEVSAACAIKLSTGICLFLLVMCVTCSDASCCNFSPSLQKSLFGSLRSIHSCRSWRTPAPTTEPSGWAGVCAPFFCSSTGCAARACSAPWPIGDSGFAGSSTATTSIFPFAPFLIFSNCKHTQAEHGVSSLHTGAGTKDLAPLGLPARGLVSVAGRECRSPATDTAGVSVSRRMLLGKS